MSSGSLQMLPSSRECNRSSQRRRGIFKGGPEISQGSILVRTIYEESLLLYIPATQVYYELLGYMSMYLFI